MRNDEIRNKTFRKLGLHIQKLRAANETFASILLFNFQKSRLLKMFKKLLISLYWRLLYKTVLPPLLSRRGGRGEVQTKFLHQHYSSTLELSPVLDVQKILNIFEIPAFVEIKFPRPVRLTSVRGWIKGGGILRQGQVRYDLNKLRH